MKVYYKTKGNKAKWQDTLKCVEVDSECHQEAIAVVAEYVGEKHPQQKITCLAVVK